MKIETHKISPSQLLLDPNNYRFHDLSGYRQVSQSRYAESGVQAKVAKIIAERATASEQSGVVPTLILLGTSADSVAGGCCVLPTDTPAIVAAKQHRQHAGPLLDAIRNLSFNEFEKFGGRVLAEIGASDIQITPSSNDQGIDFFGRLSLGQFHGINTLPFMKLAHDVVLYFAGQAS